MSKLHDDIKKLYLWISYQRFPKPLRQFFRAGGNRLLWELDIPPEALVVDAGGYQGDWAGEILSRFSCRIVIVEPIPAFQAILHRRFGMNPRVQIQQAALGKVNGTGKFSIQKDASAEFYRPSQQAVVLECRILDAGIFLDQIVGMIGCLKLNIEGGEYDVLERILETRSVRRIRHILVQFHRGPPNWEKRRNVIQENLAKTHEKIWEFPMVWEKWTLR